MYCIIIILIQSFNEMHRDCWDIIDKKIAKFILLNTKEIYQTVFKNNKAES